MIKIIFLDFKVKKKRNIYVYIYIEFRNQLKCQNLHYHQKYFLYI